MKSISLLCCLMVASLSLTGVGIQSSASPQASISTDLEMTGSTECLCVCQGPIWSIEDVYTNGTCAELVGTPCWSFGPGTYSSCFGDGGGFPL